GEERLRVLVQGGERQRGGGEGEVENRRVGGVHLLVRRRLDARGQLPQRLGDRRLHVLGGGVDVAGQRELQRDRRPADGARGRHRVEPRDRRELLFERRSHRRCHRLRARARQ